MKADIDYFRESEYPLMIQVLRGVTCHQCGSGEVHQPMQTMDMPMYWNCLRCGTYAPSSDFNHIDTEN